MKYTLFLLMTFLLRMAAFSQSFQSTLETGISIPVNKGKENYTAEGFHLGNHLNYLTGNGKVQFGLGVYAGYLHTFSTNIDYKTTGEETARKFGLSPLQLNFEASAFKSAHLLLGPVLSFNSRVYRFNCWAKAGYGLNEPGTYAVLYREGNQTRNVYVNQSAGNNNGLACNAGAGFQYFVSPTLGFQLGANYFTTKTNNVSYNFEREQGTVAAYSSVKNNFIQASAGITLKFANTNEAQRINKSKSNVKNNRMEYEEYGTYYDKKDYRITDQQYDNPEISSENETDDTLVFIPQKIVLSTTRQTPKRDFGERMIPLTSVDNYLTGFVHQRGNVLDIDQCGTSGNNGAGGIPVTLTAANGSGRSALSTTTNSDGSFAFKNIEPGHYIAKAGNETMDVLVKGNEENNYRLLTLNTATCNNGVENNIISINDTIFVEVLAPEDRSGNSAGRVLAPRDAASGLATGRRTHKPYRVSNTNFDISQQNIISYEGKIYAEVTASEEISNREELLIIGDIDGDGYAEHNVKSPRDASSGLATGKRMHKPMVLTQELNATDHNINSPRDAASGLATGRRTHKPIRFIVEVEVTDHNIKSPRDAASGLATGRRMHKPMTITMELGKSNHLVVSPRDMASGLPTGKRMHKPVTVIVELDENNHTIVSPGDASSGLATGKRTHKPIHITFDLDEVNEAVVSRDAASGLATGKRTHKPISLTINLNDVPDAAVTQRDAASGLATGKRQHKPISILIELDANNHTIVSPRDPASGLATGKRIRLSSEPYNPWDTEESDNVVSNPLYEESGVAQTNPMSGAMNKNSNPMYQGNTLSGENPMHTGSNVMQGGGENPLFESTTILRVSGSNGMEHAVVLSNIIEVNIPANAVPGQSYTVQPVKWSVPELNSQRKGIQENGIKRVEVRGWDVGKRQGIATAHILQVNRITCKSDYCTMDGIVEINDIHYDAAITGKFASIQDSVKGLMNVVR